MPPEMVAFFNCRVALSLEKRTCECIVLELGAGTKNQIKSERLIMKRESEPTFLV